MVHTIKIHQVKTKKNKLYKELLYKACYENTISTFYDIWITDTFVIQMDNIWIKAFLQSRERLCNAFQRATM